MKLRVDCPARLHLGIIDMNGGLGRLYGSIGLAIDSPRTILEAELLPPSGVGGNLLVEGPARSRVEACARRFLSRYPLPVPVHLALASSAPAHVGLGSGTQLALAVATALARLGGMESDPISLAQTMGRGTQSGIGIAVFQEGGLVVDGGQAIDRAHPAAPPVLCRHAFPAEWRLVVAIPPAPAGLSGEHEQRTFQNMPPAPARLAEQICRLLVMQMLPALVERDVVAFGRSLTSIQQHVGDGFAAAQGGRYANSLSATLVDRWLDAGAAGAGQSSWGPAVYALAGNAEEADRLTACARAFLDDQAAVFMTRGDNVGAQVEEKRCTS